jgi:hypothetical protein
VLWIDQIGMTRKILKKEAVRSVSWIKYTAQLASCSPGLEELRMKQEAGIETMSWLSVLHAPYWQRLWIIQELVITREIFFLYQNISGAQIYALDRDTVIGGFLPSNLMRCKRLCHEVLGRA